MDDRLLTILQTALQLTLTTGLRPDTPEETPCTVTVE